MPDPSISRVLALVEDTEAMNLPPLPPQTLSPPPDLSSPAYVLVVASLHILLGSCSLRLSPESKPPQPQAGPLGELIVLLGVGPDLESEPLLPCKQGREA